MHAWALGGTWAEDAGALNPAMAELDKTATEHGRWMIEDKARLRMSTSVSLSPAFSQW